MGLTETKVRLRELTWIKPAYIVPRHDFVEEALIPCLTVTDAYDCMAGFFSSGAFRDLAPGLASFIARDTPPMRLMISPFVTSQDQAALASGATDPAAVLSARLESVYGEAEVSEGALIRHTLECLAYLLATGRLVIKVALVPGGLFHPKVWLFRQGADELVLSGSANLTDSGLTRNVEQVTVARSWRGEDQVYAINELRGEFETLWDGRTPYTWVMDLPEALSRRVLQRLPTARPTPDDFWSAWEEERGIISQGDLLAFPRPLKARRFVIPAGLHYDRGNFAHQARAVEGWESAGRRGILEMATGAGKTITALVAAQRLYQETGRLLLIVAAPYLPLIEQWRQEAELFGLNPVVPNDLSSRAAKLV